MDYEKSDEGKCLTCGLLAKYSLLTQGYFEVSVSDRRHGGTPMYQCWPLGFNGVDNARVQCLIRAKNLEAMIQQRASQTGLTNAGAALDVLSVQKDCQKWWPYTPSWSPKEHLDDCRMQQLEKDRRRFERAIVRYNHATERRFQRTNITLIIISIVAATIFSLVNLWISNRESPLDRLLRQLLTGD